MINVSGPLSASKHFVSYEPALIPDENLVGVFAPRALGEGWDPQAVLRRGFEDPIDAPRLREAVEAGDRVLILIDDTRGLATSLPWRSRPSTFDSDRSLC